MIIEYIQGIYCCDVKTSYDKAIYQKYSIDLIIHCTKDYQFIDIKDIKKLRIPLSEELNYHTDIPLLKLNLDKILSYIYNNFIDYNILLVCYDGNKISPLIFGLFLNKYGNIHINLIKDIIKSKNKNFMIDFNLNIFNR